MNIIKIFAGFIFGVIAIIGIVVYFKIQETNYDFIIAQAEKLQKDHPEFVDFYGEIEPGFPNKIINTRTILGIDTNNNGVRDDVDVWINRTANDKNETKAMRQYAKAKQDWLSACEKQNVNDASLALVKLEKAKICLTTISDYQRLVSNFAKDKLELLLLNSEARKACSEFYLKVGTSKIQLNGDATNFYCDFEIQYYNNVVFGNAEWKKSTSKK